MGAFFFLMGFHLFQWNGGFKVCNVVNCTEITDTISSITHTVRRLQPGTALQSLGLPSSSTMSPRRSNFDPRRPLYHSNSTPFRAPIYHYQAPHVPLPYPQPVYTHPPSFQFSPSQRQHHSLNGIFQTSPGAAQYYGIQESPSSFRTAPASRLPVRHSAHSSDFSPSRQRRLENVRPAHQVFSEITQDIAMQANSTSTTTAKPGARKRRRGQNDPAVPPGAAK